MDAATTVHILKAHRDEIAGLGVRSLSVFGSVARDEAGPDSDVDLLVEFDDSRPVGLFAFVRLKEYLQDLLGRRVDLTTRKALRPEFRDRILAEARRAA